MRISLIKLFLVLEQFTRPIWAHSSKDPFVSNETPAEMTTASLSAMKLPELKALAASRGLKGISQLRKPQLIELLSNDASAPTTPAGAPRDEAPASFVPADRGTRRSPPNEEPDAARPRVSNREPAPPRTAPNRAPGR